MKNTTSRKVLKSEAFQLFFEDKLDKKLQYADIEELAKFVFGSIDKAVLKFEREKEDWQAIVEYKNPQ